MSHIHATLTLVFVNFFFIALAFSLHDVLELHVLLVIILSIATLLTYICTGRWSKKEAGQ